MLAIFHCYIIYQHAVFFFIIGDTKHLMARNMSVWGVASKHILGREDRFCLSSFKNDWVPLVIAQDH